MPNRIATCRHCHKPIELKEELRGNTWVERSRNYFYHIECWKQFIDKGQEKTDAEWKDLVYDLIKRELVSDYNYFMIEKQIKNMLDKGMTSKGIYFSAYYYFLIKKNEYKPEFGLGIIPYIYNEATNYWVEQESKKKGILAEIERIKTIEATQGRKIKVNRTRKKKITAAPE